MKSSPFVEVKNSLYMSGPLNISSTPNSGLSTLRRISVMAMGTGEIKSGPLIMLSSLVQSDKEIKTERQLKIDNRELGLKQLSLLKEHSELGQKICRMQDGLTNMKQLETFIMQ